MIRALLVTGALFVAAPVFACPGSTSCASSHCTMKSAEETAAAAEAVDQAAGTQLVMNVGGMKCGACSDKVTAALKGVDGVNEVAVSHVDGTATVAYDSAVIAPEKLVAAVSELGFEASLPEAEASEESSEG